VPAPNAKLRSEIISTPVGQATEVATDHAHAQGAPTRLSWARLPKRVVDIEHCPNCGGSLKIIAALAALRVNQSERELALIYRWLGNWTGIGHIVVGMERQGAVTTKGVRAGCRCVQGEDVPGGRAVRAHRKD
jgi:hypothetical protein